MRKNEADLEASPAMFTITPNPISSEANEDATTSVKKLPDYCLPAEDASQQ